MGRQEGFLTFQNEHAQWLTHYYPLYDLAINRYGAQQICEREGIVYVLHSQCYFCPHQDWQRWSQRSSEYIKKAVQMEESFGGEFFLTDRRKPLLIALEEMRREEEGRAAQVELDFGCQNDVCGI